MNTLYMIGNTHFDPVWLWTWDEALASLRATFRAALERMRETEDFIYSFSTPAVFEWIEQVDPEMFEEIRQRVAEGRWDVGAEGWWLQPECYNPCGESIIRQSLYGQRYLKDRFDRYATTVFNIDSFGHGVMIPQIMRKSGLKYYVFGRPTHSEKELEDSLFQWEGIDGSRVMAYRSGSSDAAGSYPPNVAETIENWRKILPAMKHDAAQVYGVADHGGAPTKQAISDICDAMQANKDIAVRFGTTEDFFSAQEDKVLSVYNGELLSLNYGTLSDRPEVKRNNRCGEYAILHAERASLLASQLCGRAYPQEKIYQCWKDLMFNQFHDITGGCCIPEAFFDARNMHGRVLQSAAEVKNFAIQSMCRKMQTLGDNETSVWNVCLFNLNATPYRGIVEAEVQWAWQFPWYTGGIELVDETGAVHAAQVITEKSAIPGFRSRFAFETEIPAMGWRMYAVRQTAEPIERCRDDKGIESPFRFCAYEDEGDTWCFNTVEGYGEACEEPVLAERRIAEQGELLTTVYQRWSFRDSRLEEWITVYPQTNRTDYRYRVNWNEKNKVLKLIPKCFNADAVTASIPCGAVSRPTDGREYSSGKWLRWGEGSETCTLLLDGVFAYDTSETLRLTLLRSPLYGDLRTRPLDPQELRPYMGQGVHEGRICVIRDSLTNAEAEACADHWLAQPIVVCEANHPGTLPPVYEGIRIDGNAALSALKKAEDNDGTILRLIEMNGEENDVKVAVDSRQIALHLTPYEIKTVLINKDGTWQETDILERE